MKSLFDTFKRWLTPPVFEDETKSHQAFILHVILWTLVCVPIPYLVYSLIQTPDQTGRVWAQVIFGEVANILALYTLRRGQVRAASILQVSLFWIFLAGTAISSGGVQSEAYLLGYSLAIVIAGILLGGRGATVFTVLSLTSGAVMMYLYAQGRITNGFIQGNLSCLTERPAA